MCFSVSCTKSGKSVKDLYNFPSNKDIAVEVNINYQLAPGVGPQISLSDNKFLLNAYLIDGTESTQVEISRVGGEMLKDLPVTLDATVVKFPSIIRVPASAKPSASGYNFHFALIDQTPAAIPALAGELSTVKNLDALKGEVKPGTAAETNPVTLSLATKIAYDFLLESGIQSINSELVAAYAALTNVISERVTANENLAIPGKTTDLATYVRALKAVVKLDVVNTADIQQAFYDAAAPFAPEGFVTNFDKAITGYFTEAKTVLADAEKAEPGLFNKVPSIPAKPPIITDAPSKIAFTDTDITQALGGTISFEASKNSQGVLSYNIYFGGASEEQAKISLIKNLEASATLSYLLPSGTIIPEGASGFWVYPVKAEGVFPQGRYFAFKNVLSAPACLLASCPCLTGDCGGGVGPKTPVAPSSLQSVAEGYSIRSTWTASTSVFTEGYVLVRKLGGAPHLEPTNGLSYTLGPIDNGVEVLYVGSDLTALDESLQPGDYYYEVFAYSSDKVYSLAAASNAKIVSNSWAWLTGSSNVPVISRGQKGVASPTNSPGSRRNAVVCGRDSVFYLYGGEDDSYHLYSDLWRFSEGQWAWIAGSDALDLPAVVTHEGGSFDGNTPGGLTEARCAIDLDGDFWMFGGQGYDTTSPITQTVFLDHLWHYSVSQNQWALEAGHPNCQSSDCKSIYPSQNMGTGRAGARKGHSMVFDSQNRLYVYGGLGIVGNTLKYDMADLWRFYAPTRYWNFISGDSFVTREPSIGTGPDDVTNVPGGRNNAAIASYGTDIFIFGGEGAGPLGSRGLLNDIWYWKNNENRWVVGPNFGAVNRTGIYGTQGEAAQGNFPGGRKNAQLWVTPDNGIFIFGGQGYGMGGTSGPLNDLWQFAQTKWQWLRGSSSKFGTELKGPSGVADESYSPAARSALASTFDTGSGRLLMLGGASPVLTLTSVPSGQTLDLWTFNPAPINNCPPFSAEPNFCFAPPFN